MNMIEKVDLTKAYYLQHLITEHYQECMDESIHPMAVVYVLASSFCAKSNDVLFFNKTYILEKSVE